MALLTPGRQLHAVLVRRPAGHQLLRTQLDAVRAQQVPPRATAVRRAARPVRRRSETALVHRAGEKRKTRRRYVLL